jgi:hypothetical protein
MPAFLIEFFDIWQPGYGGSTVTVYVAGTTTLAGLYTDEAMTAPFTDNPVQLLSQLDDDGTRYGKFPVPLYTDSAYYLDIDQTEQTGVFRPPLYSLDAADASAAEVTPTGSSYPVSLGDIASREVYAENYGPIATSDASSAAQNTTTINLAIAALTNGGRVILPPGRIRHNAISIPEGVVLEGQGESSTVLESIVGDKVYTLTGARAGFRRLTLDGVNLAPNSIGVYSVGHDETIFDAAVVQRFETNAVIKGGNGHRWRDLKNVNSVNGFRILGDTDAANGGLGGPVQDIVWAGGLVTQNTTTGVEMSYEDALCQNILFIGVGFEDNPGTAEKFNGAQFVQHISCWWSGNVTNWDIMDDTLPLTPATSLNNDTIGIRVIGGRMNGGVVKVKDTAQDIILDNLKINGVTFNLLTPLANQILLLGCTETNVTVTGETIKLLRQRLTDRGESFGLTTSNVQTKAWSLELQPGQLVNLKGRIIGRQRNGVDRAAYEISIPAYRPGATLAYDTQTANFTLGDVLTGATSGATARIVGDVDGGTTGTLTLNDIKGTFVDNETITGSTTGSASANGTTAMTNVSLFGPQTNTLIAESDTSWNALFVANGPEVELQVLGATNKTVEWTVNVDVVST